MKDKKLEIPERQKCGQFDLLVIQNRIGKFRISDHIAEFGLSELLTNVFAKVFIVRAEHLPYVQATEYVGYSELFKPQQQASEPEDYVFEAKKEEDGTITITSKTFAESLNAVSV